MEKYCGCGKLLFIREQNGKVERKQNYTEIAGSASYPFPEGKFYCDDCFKELAKKTES